MCDESRTSPGVTEGQAYRNQGSGNARTESYTLLELKAKRDKIIYELVQVQKAIDAVQSLYNI